MSQVSKYPISKDAYRRIFEIFLESISGLKTKKQLAGFLDEFLSPTEQVMLAKRLAIAFLLAKKYDYREISKILRVSTGTISRVATSLKLNKNFRGVIDNLLKNEEMEKFWLNIGEKVASILSAGGKTKSGAWVYLKEEIRKKKQDKSF